MQRFRVSVALLFGVFLYGALGHYILLYPEVPFLQCALRTILLLGTINEAFSPEELGAQYDTHYIVFMLSLVIFGIAVILYALSTITAFFVEGNLQEMWRFRKMSREIADLENHFIICGAGETGHYVADELAVSHRRFVVVEKDHERIERLREEGIFYVEGDAADEIVLQAAGIERARGIAVALPSDKENLFVTITARQMNPDLVIIAKGIDATVDRKLVTAGANKVVRPAAIGGMRIASELIRPEATSFMDRMLRDPVDTTRIEEVIIEEGGSLTGQTIATSQFRQKTGLQVVAIRQPDERRFDFHPQAYSPLQAGTVLVVIGRTEDVAKARTLAGMD